jgi:hypothetical protein
MSQLGQNPTATRIPLCLLPPAAADIGPREHPLARRTPAHAPDAPGAPGLPGRREIERSATAKQGFIDCPTDASGMRRQLSPAADIASDRLW